MNQEKFLLAVLFIVCCSTVASGSIITQSNGYFTVYCDTYNGLFTIATGASHPAGSGFAVLYGGDSQEPLTSYVSIYSNKSGIEYVNADAVENATLLIPDSVSGTGTGCVSIYTVDEDDDFTVTVNVQIHGNTYETSVVSWTANVHNDAGSAVPVGVRFLWDYQIAEDDGPTLQTINPDSGKYSFEMEWDNVYFQQAKIAGNRPLSTYFEIDLAAKGPVDWQPQSKPALSRISFTSWQETFNTPFAYSLQPDLNVAVNLTKLEDDSCIILYWGHSAGTFHSIPAGGDFVVVSSFSVTVVDAPEEIIANCYDNFTCTYDFVNFRDDFTFDCIFIPINYVCDDGNPCTTDKCDPFNHEYEEDTGCAYIEIDCSDQIPCTMDMCNVTSGECEHYPLECNDGVDCTSDKCDEALGTCTNTPNDQSCVDALTEPDLCHTYYCDKTIGCYSEPILCDDDIHCTIDTCNPATGCVFTPADFLCDDNVTCTEDTCQESIGKCVNVPKNSWCDDYDACTTDLCDINLDCVSESVDCADPDMTCTFDFCLNGTCLHIAMNDRCDDMNNCTIDICNMVEGNCFNTPADELCDDDQWCTSDHCDELEGCLYTERNCDDEIHCTDDYCDYFQERCIHSVANETMYCDDHIECTIDLCDLDLGRCNNVPEDLFCDDQDPCTTDMCSPSAGGCVHHEMYCNDQIACTNDTCVNGECIHTPQDMFCEDGFYCTVDTCDDTLGQCTNIPTNALCNDHVMCTLDICNYTHCLNIAEHDKCEDNIPCTINECHEDGCHLTVDHDICNDGIDCTYDYCDPDFGCRYVLNHTVCDDEFECIENICDLQEGCIAKYHDELCKDEWDCTSEKCAAFVGCVIEENDALCNDDVGCTVDTCTEGFGCSHNASDWFCEDGRSCSTEYCDLDYGCVINDTSCPIDEDCEHCVNCKAARTRIIVNDLEDGGGELLLRTRNVKVADYSIASPTEGLVDNLLLKGSGPVVLGNEEFLDVDDGLVIGSSSAFRLVPSSEQLPVCNDITRGLVSIVEEWSGIELVDNLYICLQNENTYKWKKFD